MDQPLGDQAPSIHTPLPGPRSEAWVQALAAAECPAITARRARRQELSGSSNDPIVWRQAYGSNVWDADGNRFVDLTSGFGVAAAGHRNERVMAAVQDQLQRQVHGLGDVHPSEAKVRLLERLCALAPWTQARVILGQNGADAVEAALKTAVLATGRPGVVAFEGGYHGLSYGALTVCGYKSQFRAPFEAQLNPAVVFAPYPDAQKISLDRAMQQVLGAWDRSSHAESVGAVLVEPILGRGGVVVPPFGFVRALGEQCRQRGAVLIVDEVLTGLGRCGRRWAADHSQTDLLCVGKALGGGFPLSACLGRADVMAHWGQPDSEALHTGTFWGHPVSAAAALAMLELLEEQQLAEQAQQKGERLVGSLRAGLAECSAVTAVRGQGLLIGVVLREPQQALRCVRALMEEGYLTLPAGPEANVVQIVPPWCISERLLELFSDTLRNVLCRS